MFPGGNVSSCRKFPALFEGIPAEDGNQKPSLFPNCGLKEERRLSSHTTVGFLIFCHIKVGPGSDIHIREHKSYKKFYFFFLLLRAKMNS